MSHFALVAAVVLGFALTAAVCSLIVPIQKVLGTRAAEPERQPDSPLPEREPEPPVPIWGGLCLMLGVLAAVGIGWTALCAMQPELLTSGSSLMSRLLAGLFGGFVFGAVGLLDDLTRLRNRSVLGLRRLPRLALEIGASVLVLGMLAAEGAVPMGAVLPGGGYISFGVWAPVLWVLLLTALAECARTAEPADGVPSMAVFVAMLGAMMMETKLGAFPLAVLPGAIAGGLVALLLWNFPPAKLRLGCCGSLFLAGAVGCIPLSIGSPELSIPLALPFWAEGGVVLMQILWMKSVGVPLFDAAPLHRWLEKRGADPALVLGAMTLLSVCGLALTMLLLRWY